MYMYKEDLALNNLQWLICHKTQPNQTISTLPYFEKKEKRKKESKMKSSLSEIGKETSGRGQGLEI